MHKASIANGPGQKAARAKTHLGCLSSAEELTEPLYARGDDGL